MPRKPKTFNLHRKTKAQKNAQAKRRQAKRALHTGSKAWRAIRKEQLDNEPLCRECTKDCRVTEATVVDHMDGDAYNNKPDNLQSLCRECHNTKTAKETGF